jgi:hypothetical protein
VRSRLHPNDFDVRSRLHPNDFDVRSRLHPNDFDVCSRLHYYKVFRERLIITGNSLGEGTVSKPDVWQSLSGSTSSNVSQGVYSLSANMLIVKCLRPQFRYLWPLSIESCKSLLLRVHAHAYEPGDPDKRTSYVPCTQCNMLR